MDAMETPLEQSARMPEETGTAEEPRCPLCERLIKRRWLRKNPKKTHLNEVVVCRRCRNGFASRRQGAFIIDSVIACFLAYWVNRAMTEMMVWAGGAPAGPALGPVGGILISVLLLFKDGFSGQSPGKAILGLQVIDWDTRSPIGFGRSVKRNLPLAIPYLAPYVALVLAFTLLKGWRWGDRWARTRVIWKKHAFKLPFDPWGIRCPICGYDLTGNVSGICPECGTLVGRPTPPVVIGQAKC